MFSRHTVTRHVSFKEQELLSPEQKLYECRNSSIVSKFCIELKQLP